MKNATGDALNQPDEVAQADNKKKYEAPRVLYREPLEAVAAACSTDAGGKDTATPACTFTSRS